MLSICNGSPDYKPENVVWSSGATVAVCGNVKTHGPHSYMTAKIIRGVGGKAFPRDYNWVCPTCKTECRSFETECAACRWEVEVKQAGYAA